MSYERILLDIDTQRDFFVPSGSMYTGQAGQATGNVYRLFDWARRYSIPVISTVLRVRAFRRGPMGQTPHCVDGTAGERKLSRAILPRRIDLGLLNTTDMPANIFHQYQQVIFEQRDTDIFAHARAERLLTELRHATFVVCGAGVAQGIVQAVVGLRSRGFGVIVASDAILDFDHDLAPMAYLRMEAKGAIFAPTADIITPLPANPRRPAAAAFRCAKLSAMRK
jgi:nicotinamidase-related amidase